MSSSQKEAVLVTKAAGFIGAWLCAALLGRGYSVIAQVHNRPYQPPPGTAPASHVVVGDILDLDFLERVVKQYEVQGIIHSAAVSGTVHGDELPISTVRVNVLGATHVYEVARRRHLRRVVSLSTGTVYGVTGVEHRELTEDEAGRLPTTSMYGATKLAAEAVAISYRERHDVDVGIGRLSRVFGFGRGYPPLLIENLFR